MFLDQLELTSHRTHLAIVSFVTRQRERLLENASVALAYLARKRRQLIDALDREEAVIMEDIESLREKLGKASDARHSVASFLDSLGR